MLQPGGGGGGAPVGHLRPTAFHTEPKGATPHSPQNYPELSQGAGGAAAGGAADAGADAGACAAGAAAPPAAAQPASANGRTGAAAVGACEVRWVPPGWAPQRGPSLSRCSVELRPGECAVAVTVSDHGGEYFQVGFRFLFECL